MHAVLMRVRTAHCAASCDSSDMYRVQCTCYLYTSAYYCYYRTCGTQDVVGRRPFLSICQRAFYWLYVCICVLSLLNYLSVCVLIIPVISYFREFRPASTQSWRNFFSSLFRKLIGKQPKYWLLGVISTIRPTILII